MYHKFYVELITYTSLKLDDGTDNLFVREATILQSSYLIITT